jgi:site-specific recombinase XerD
MEKSKSNLSWQDVLEDFILWKKAQGLSDLTLRDFQNHVELFFKKYPNCWQDNLKSAALKYMSDKKIKPATFNLRLVNLKAFFNWLVDEEFIPDNPLKGLKRRKAESRIVNIDTDILKKLLTLPDKHTFAGLRDYTLILLTLDTGIRPKEAFSLLIDDFNIRSLEIYIRSEVAKTKVSRTLPISPITATSIKDLMNARHKSWKDSVPVFCSAEGTYLNRYTWGDRLEMYSDRMGAKIRPYDLRHVFALEFLRNGGHALALQRTLGHTDLSMTKRYVALTGEDLKEQHTLASPLNSLIEQKNRVRKISRG